MFYCYEIVDTTDLPHKIMTTSSIRKGTSPSLEESILATVARTVGMKKEHGHIVKYDENRIVVDVLDINVD